MSDADDIDTQAAEYVLGTLDLEERLSVTARRQREPALNAAIESWERRLQPLNAMALDVQPSPAMLGKLMARIDHDVIGVRTSDQAILGESATIIALNRRVARWRAAALATSAIAASLLVFVGSVLLPGTTPPRDRTFTVLLQKDATAPAFLMTVDPSRRRLAINPLAAKAPGDQAFELWLIHDKYPGPRSLGVVGEPEGRAALTLTQYEPDVLMDATYAVTLEPRGGSQSGKPTGAVISSGKVGSGSF